MLFKQMQMIYMDQTDGFKQKKMHQKFDKKFIRNYDEDSDKGYIFEIDVKYPKRLHNLHSH